MPSELEPLTRRDFLKGSGVAVASLALAPLGNGAETTGNVETLALLSDTHISQDRQKTHASTTMASNFERVRQEILGLIPRPSRVLLNGDCAFLMGKAEDYETLVELSEPIRMAGIGIDMTLGNHDDRNVFPVARLTDGQSSLVENKIASVRETSHVNWFLLDSLEEVNQTPGSLGETQIQWLNQALGERSTKPAFVMFHHNVDYFKHLKAKGKVVEDVAKKRLPVPGIIDDSALLEVLKSHKHVSAYFCGHTHQWNVIDWEGIHVVNLPTTAYIFTPDDPNGWVVCRHTGDSTELELRALDVKHKAHGRKIAIPHRGA